MISKTETGSSENQSVGVGEQTGLALMRKNRFVHLTKMNHLKVWAAVLPGTEGGT